MAKNREIDKRMTDIKIVKLKKTVYYKYANSLGGIKGFGYLVLNFKKTSLFYVLSYLKKILLSKR